MTELKGNALIAQSGGPTPVINSTLVGAILGAKEFIDKIPKFFGSKNALEGCVSGEPNLVDLYAQRRSNLELISQTPGSALGSSRKKVGKDISAESVIDFFKKKNIRHFLYIGGNDSADNARMIYDESKRMDYDLNVIHLPKTIDNDLLENDHTPGFGSAARYVALAFRGDDKDNASLPGVKINVVMGRNAGFLTAASALAREREGDGPHLIYLPEVNFYKDNFLRDVEQVYKKNKRAVIAVSEGILDESNLPIGWNGKKDGHGNYELEGRLVADRLCEIIKDSGLTKRVRSDVFGYIQRSFFSEASEPDLAEARNIGRIGINYALSGKSGSVAIKKDVGRFDYPLVPLDAVAKNTRTMPQEFISDSGNDVTKAFLDYAGPLVGDLPTTGRLE